MILIRKSKMKKNKLRKIGNNIHTKILMLLSGIGALC